MSEAREPAALVAVINTSEETAELLQALLEDEGYRTAVGYVVDFKRGRQDLAAFLRQHEPAVVLWDIALPYEENWRYFCSVRDSGLLDGRSVVLSTTNKDALDALVGPTPAHEVIGRPFDIAAVLEAVRRALPPTP